MAVEVQKALNNMSLINLVRGEGRFQHSEASEYKNNSEDMRRTTPHRLEERIPEKIKNARYER